MHDEGDVLKLGLFSSFAWIFTKSKTTYILSRAKGAGSPVNRQSAGQRRDTVQKSLRQCGSGTSQYGRLSFIGIGCSHYYQWVSHNGRWVNYVQAVVLGMTFCLICQHRVRGTLSKLHFFQGGTSYLMSVYGDRYPPLYCFKALVHVFELNVLAISLCSTFGSFTEEILVGVRIPRWMHP